MGDGAEDLLDRTERRLLDGCVHCGKGSEDSPEDCNCYDEKGNLKKDVTPLKALNDFYQFRRFWSNE